MSVLEQLESVRKNFLADLETFPDNPREIGELRSKYLGRKGDVASLFSLMGKASAEERPILGQNLNALKEELSDLFEQKVSSVSKSQQNAEDVKIIDEKIHDNELKKLDGMNNKMLSLLAQNNIVTIDDFADLASFELIDKEEGIFKDLDVDENTVNNMIMKAREKWFSEDK